MRKYFYILTTLYIISFGCQQNKRAAKTENEMDSTTFQIAEKEAEPSIQPFDPQEVWPYYINARWGYFSNDNKMVIPIQFDACGFYSEGFSWVKKDGQFHIINDKGELIKTTQNYDALGKTQHQLIPVKEEKRWGACDTTGKLVIEPKYRSFIIEEDGRINVEENNRWGIIDWKGKEICPPLYYDKIEFKGDFALVRRDYQSYGLLNKKGKEVVPCRYSDVKIVNDTTFILKKEINYKLNRYALYRSGKQVTEFDYDRIEHIADSALVWVKNKLAGALTLKGDTLIPFEYEDLKAGNTNLLAAKKEDKWGYINLQNEVVIDFQYKHADAFHSQCAVVYGGYTRSYSDKPDQQGLINFKGETLIPISTQRLSYLNDKLLLATTGYNQVQLYKTNGKLIDSMVFDREQFHSEPDYVTGNYAREMKLYEFHNGFAIVAHHGRVGMINSAGEIVIPLKYHHIEPMNKYGFTKVQFLDKFGIVSSTGKEIVAPAYENIGYDETYGFFYLQEEISGTSKWNSKFKNIGYWNYEGELFSNTPYKNAKPYDIEEDISEIRKAYQKIQNRQPLKNVKESTLEDKMLLYKYSAQKEVVRDTAQKITYEYYYDNDLNAYGPFFIFKVQEGKEDRYYFKDGRIIRWIDEHKEDRIISDALFAYEHPMHRLARQHSQWIKNKQTKSMHPIAELKQEVDNQTAVIDEDIKKGRYKRGDTKSRSSGEYQHNIEEYIVEEKRRIYFKEAASDEGGSDIEEMYYTEGKLLRAFETKYQAYEPENSKAPYWAAGQYEVTKYYKDGQVIFEEITKQGITKINLKAITD